MYWLDVHMYICIFVYWPDVPRFPCFGYTHIFCHLVISYELYYIIIYIVHYIHYIHCIFIYYDMYIYRAWETSVPTPPEESLKPIQDQFLEQWDTIHLFFPSQDSKNVVQHIYST